MLQNSRIKAGKMKMFNKMTHMFSKSRHPKGKTAETRVELKTRLDHFASEKATITDLMDCLKKGNPRTVEISDEKITLSMGKSGTKYFWRRSDPRTAIACLVTEGEYESLETEILKYFAINSSTFVDVGANVGYYVVELSNFLGAKAEIHAFEPVPESFAQLMSNVELNEISTLTKCHQLAISDSEGSIRLYQPKSSGSSASSARNLHPSEDVEEIDVSTTTLDIYIESQKLTTFDLLKIDVEGAELFVIRGALNSIKQFKPVIFAELLRKWSAHFNYHPNEVLRLLLPLGYKCFAVSPSFPEILEIDEKTVETNFIFIHADKMFDVNHFREKVIIKK